MGLEGFLERLAPALGIRVLIGLLIAWANAAEQVAVVALFRYAKDKKMPQIYQDQGMTVYTFGNAQTV